MLKPTQITLLSFLHESMDHGATTMLAYHDCYCPSPNSNDHHSELSVQHGSSTWLEHGEDSSIVITPLVHKPTCPSTSDAPLGAVPVPSSPSDGVELSTNNSTSVCLEGDVELPKSSTPDLPCPNKLKDSLAPKSNINCSPDLATSPKLSKCLVPTHALAHIPAPTSLALPKSLHDGLHVKPKSQKDCTPAKLIDGDSFVEVTTLRRYTPIGLAVPDQHQSPCQQPENPFAALACSDEDEDDVLDSVMTDTQFAVEVETEATLVAPVVDVAISEHPDLPTFCPKDPLILPLFKDTKTQDHVFPQTISTPNGFIEDPKTKSPLSPPKAKVKPDPPGEKGVKTLDQPASPRHTCGDEQETRPQPKGKQIQSIGRNKKKAQKMEQNVPAPKPVMQEELKLLAPIKNPRMLTTEVPKEDDVYNLFSETMYAEPCPGKHGELLEEFSQMEYPFLSKVQETLPIHSFAQFEAIIQDEMEIDPTINWVPFRVSTMQDPVESFNEPSKVSLEPIFDKCPNHKSQALNFALGENCRGTKQGFIYSIPTQGSCTSANVKLPAVHPELYQKRSSKTQFKLTKTEISQAYKSNIAASKKAKFNVNKFCCNLRKKQGNVMKPQNKRDDPKHSCPSVQDCSKSVKSKKENSSPVLDLAPLAQKQLDTGKVPLRSLYQDQKTQVTQAVVHEQHPGKSVPSNKERKKIQKSSTKPFQEMDEQITESQENLLCQGASSSKIDAKNLQPELPEQVSRGVEQLKHDIVEEECGSLKMQNPCTKTETDPVSANFPNELQAMCSPKPSCPRASLDLRTSNNIQAPGYIQYNKTRILDRIEPESLPVSSTFKTLTLHQPMLISSGCTAVPNPISGLGDMPKFSALEPASLHAKEEEQHFAKDSPNLQFEPSAWNLALKSLSLLERYSRCTMERKLVPCIDQLVMPLPRNSKSISMLRQPYVLYQSETVLQQRFVTEFGLAVISRDAYFEKGDSGQGPEPRTFHDVHPTRESEPSLQSCKSVYASHAGFELTTLQNQFPFKMSLSKMLCIRKICTNGFSTMVILPSLPASSSCACSLRQLATMNRNVKSPPSDKQCPSHKKKAAGVLSNLPENLWASWETPISDPASYLSAVSRFLSAFWSSNTSCDTIDNDHDYDVDEVICFQEEEFHLGTYFHELEYTPSGDSEDKECNSSKIRTSQFEHGADTHEPEAPFLPAKMNLQKGRGIIDQNLCRNSVRPFQEVERFPSGPSKQNFPFKAEACSTGKVFVQGYPQTLCKSKAEFTGQFIMSPFCEDLQTKSTQFQSDKSKRRTMNNFLERWCLRCNNAKSSHHTCATKEERQCPFPKLFPASIFILSQESPTKTNGQDVTPMLHELSPHPILVSLPNWYCALDVRGPPLSHKHILHDCCGLIFGKNHIAIVQCPRRKDTVHKSIKKINTRMDQRNLAKSNRFARRTLKIIKLSPHHKSAATKTNRTGPDVPNTLDSIQAWKLAATKMSWSIIFTTLNPEDQSTSNWRTLSKILPKAIESMDKSQYKPQQPLSNNLWTQQSHMELKSSETKSSQSQQKDMTNDVFCAMQNLERFPKPDKLPLKKPPIFPKSNSETSSQFAVHTRVEPYGPTNPNGTAGRHSSILTFGNHKDSKENCGKPSSKSELHYADVEKDDQRTVSKSLSCIDQRGELSTKINIPRSEAFQKLSTVPFYIQDGDKGPEAFQKLSSVPVQKQNANLPVASNPLSDFLESSKRSSHWPNQDEKLSITSHLPSDCLKPLKQICLWPNANGSRIKFVSELDRTMGDSKEDKDISKKNKLSNQTGCKVDLIGAVEQEFNIQSEEYLTIISASKEMKQTGHIFETISTSIYKRLMWVHKQDIIHNLCCHVPGNVLHFDTDTNQNLIGCLWSQVPSTGNTECNIALLQACAIQFDSSSILSLSQREIFATKLPNNANKSLPKIHCDTKTYGILSGNLHSVTRSTLLPIKTICMQDAQTPVESNSPKGNKQATRLLLSAMSSQCIEVEKNNCCKQCWLLECKSDTLCQKPSLIVMEFQQNLPDIGDHDNENNKHPESSSKSKSLTSKKPKVVSNVQNFLGTKFKKPSSCWKFFNNFQSPQNLQPCYPYIKGKWIIADCATKKPKMSLHSLFETTAVSTHGKLRLKRSVETDADKVSTLAVSKTIPLLCEVCAMQEHTGYNTPKVILALWQVYIIICWLVQMSVVLSSVGTSVWNNAEVAGSIPGPMPFLYVQLDGQNSLCILVFLYREFSERSQITWCSDWQNFVQLHVLEPGCHIYFYLRLIRVEWCRFGVREEGSIPSSHNLQQLSYLKAVVNNTHKPA